MLYIYIKICLSFIDIYGKLLFKGLWYIIVDYILLSVLKKGRLVNGMDDGRLKRVEIY